SPFFGAAVVFAVDDFVLVRVVVFLATLVLTLFFPYTRSGSFSICFIDLPEITDLSFLVMSIVFAYLSFAFISSQEFSPWYEDFTNAYSPFSFSPCRLKTSFPLCN